MPESRALLKCALTVWWSSLSSTELLWKSCTWAFLQPPLNRTHARGGIPPRKVPYADFLILAKVLYWLYMCGQSVSSTWAVACFDSFHLPSPPLRSSNPWVNVLALCRPPFCLVIYRLRWNPIAVCQVLVWAGPVLCARGPGYHALLSPAAAADPSALFLCLGLVHILSTHSLSLPVLIAIIQATPEVRQLAIVV